MQKYNIRGFIGDAKELYNKGHYETSLSLVCCAVDACAKNIYPKHQNATRIKLWIDSHIRTISQKGLPVSFGHGCKFEFGSIPNLRKDEHGYSGMEDVIYSLIRCALIHECTLSESIILGNEEVFSWSNNIITLPPKLYLA